ncbi:NfeD family protein [Butyricicoccus sp. 1XD8-22]|nr:NfeD family protein [Butyricicoccus sp. 1XD8-22]
MPMLRFSPILLWIAVILVTVALEAATLTLSSIWFSVGGIAALIAASLGFGFGSQLVVFVLFSAALLVLVRPFCRRFLRPKGAATNADRVIGQTAVVTEEIRNVDAVGAVQVFGQVWTARSADGKDYPAGTQVVVREIQGVKVIVDKKEETGEG